MATKKNYDKYNMFSSSAKKEEKEKTENRSVAARIFERRGQALNRKELHHRIMGCLQQRYSDRERNY